MKLRTAAVNVTDDAGNKVGGPYFLPLDADAKREIKGLEREFGPLELKKDKEQSCSTKR